MTRCIELLPDEEEATSTFRRLHAEFSSESAVALTAALIVARAIKMANYKPSVEGYYDHD